LGHSPLLCYLLQVHPLNGHWARVRAKKVNSIHATVKNVVVINKARSEYKGLWSTSTAALAEW